MKTNNPTTKVLLCVLVLCSLILFSCKKDGSGNNTSGSNSSISLLTKSRWTFVKFEYQKTDGTWIIDPYLIDREPFTLGFNTDNTALEIELITNITITSTWHFSSNNTILTIATEGGGEVLSAAYTVNQLSSSSLVITNPSYRLSGALAERITFTR